MRGLIQGWPKQLGSTWIDHKYIEVNEAFQNLLGFDKSEVIGKTASELGVVTDEMFNAILLKADSNGSTVNQEIELKAKNGEIKHVLLSAENIYVQDKKYRFTVIHDITERKKTEEALRESEYRWKFAIEGSGSGAWEWNVQSDEIILNERLAEIIGYTVDELKPVRAATWVKYAHPDDHEYFVNIFTIIVRPSPAPSVFSSSIKKLSLSRSSGESFLSICSFSIKVIFCVFVTHISID